MKESNVKEKRWSHHGGGFSSCVLGFLNSVTDYVFMPIRLLFLREKESYSVLYRILGFYPRNISLYRQALLHKSSSVKDSGGRPVNNERMEFLGDAILDAVVSDIVYHRFWGKREGFLTNTRSKIVQRETLDKVATQIGLDKLIQSQTKTGPHNSHLCGNALEAFIGAIYLDRGYEYCMRFVEKRIISPYINLDKLAYEEINFKSKLIEWGQKKRVRIEFELIDERKDDAQSPIFESRVLIEGVEFGQGMGYSKKESQQMAAKIALKMVKKEKEIIKKILPKKEAEVPADA